MTLFKRCVPAGKEDNCNSIKDTVTNAALKTVFNRIMHHQNVLKFIAEIIILSKS